jgi:hypothetical protein
MALETLELKLSGTRPLLMHNGRLADPSNSVTRALKPLTSKRGKTDEDFEEIRRLEWLGGLYLDDNGRISLTEDVVLGAGIEGARKAKKGKQMTAGVLGSTPYFPLEYKGPREPLELFRDSAFVDYRLVVVGQARTMRARPRFNNWSAIIRLLVETTIINIADVLAAYQVAGVIVGIGDFRPRCGGFEVQRV